MNPLIGVDNIYRLSPLIGCSRKKVLFPYLGRPAIRARVSSGEVWSYNLVGGEKKTVSLEVKVYKTFVWSGEEASGVASKRVVKSSAFVILLQGGGFDYQDQRQPSLGCASDCIFMPLAWQRDQGKQPVFINFS